MAEASQEKTTPDRRNKINLVKRIFRLIKNNSLAEIMEIFDTFQPEQCINIVNSSMYGFIPLYLAVKYKNVEISSYLLELALLQGPDKMSEHWKKCRHPLNAAIKAGNPELVILILQHLSDINDKINGSLTPLALAASHENLMSMKLIVAMGANINRTGFNGRSPLMESTSNSEICKCLISLGANVNQQDDDGFTALHIAVARKHRESVIHLVKAGADFKMQSHEGMNPLIWSTINRDDETFKYFTQHPDCSALDKIEALEIMNARFLGAQMSDIVPWREALRLRTEKNLPKNCQIPAIEVLGFSQEFTTEVELENLKDKPLNLAFQSILVVERIIGRNNRLYMLLLLQTALIAKKENDIEKVRKLIAYIQEYFQELPVSVTDNFRAFKFLFNELGKGSLPKNHFEYGTFSIFKIISQAAVKAWRQVKDHVYNNPYLVDSSYYELVDTFLYMTSTIKTNNCSQDYHSRFNEVVKVVVREDIRFRLRKSILCRAINLMKTQPWGSVELIKILLESGADPNAKDYFRRTPIMYAHQHVPEHIRNHVLVLLTKYVGQPKCRNSEGFTVGAQSD